MKSRNIQQNVELLAPAGNPACAIAAFDAGADAVYAGLKRFNARERTENFSVEDLDRLLGYARKNGKKVYVTFNTLIKENELSDAATELANLELLHPDAVIVQDLGIVRLIREYFPGLTVHASTQMGLHNSAGLRFAQDLGVTRVILERQTTLREIEAMMQAKPPEIELEMFIHGALCCSISGTCLLSSWLGGWSGNRGKCKQPCRRRYHAENGSGFFLSSQDLCTLEILPDILRSGVRSLKIEGRLRRADYVENAVAAYRLAMDAAADSEQAFREAMPRAKELLTKTCGRKWSLGYYTEQSRRGLIKYDTLGASGLLCGKVVSSEKNGFTVSPSRRLHLGDVIRVQPRSGDEGPAITITKMSVNGQSVSRALKGEIVLIHSDKPVVPESLVYKTGESVSDYSKRIAALPARKTPVDLKISLDRRRIEVRAAGKTWTRALNLEEAGSHPLLPETVMREFASASTESLAAGHVQAEVAENPFLPSSVLKSLRKEFSGWMAENITSDMIRADNRARLKAFQDHYAAMRPPQSASFPDAAIVPRGKHLHRTAAKGMAIVRGIGDSPSPREELLLPFFIRESRLSAVRGQIEEFIAKGGKCVRITSVHHLELLKGCPGLTVKTCMPLPVCNSMAAEELASFGTALAQAWLELGKTELEELARKSPLPLEQYTYGRPVLLATHADIPAEGKLTDARGNEFLISRDHDLTLLTADCAMDVPKVRGMVCVLADYRHADGTERKTRLFNFDCGLS